MGKINKKELAKKAAKLLPYVVPAIQIILLFASDAYAQGITPRGVARGAGQAAEQAQRALAMAAALRG